MSPASAILAFACALASVCALAGAVLRAAAASDTAPGAPAPPAAFETLRFEDLAGGAAPSREALRRLLAPAGEGEHALSGGEGERPPGFEGLFALALPPGGWGPDAVLRIAFEERRGVRIHLWSGEAGVTLESPEGQRTWFAHAAVREGQAPRPSRTALAAADGGLHARAGGGLFELRHEAGSIVMSRGDVLLLAAPLDGPPEQVFLEGRASVHGLELARSGPFPLASPAPRPALLLLERPAEADWRTPPGSPAIARLEGGAAELSAEGREARAWIPLPGAAPFVEVLLEVEGAMPGTAAYLGAADGTPLEAVEVSRAEPGGAAIGLRGRGRAAPALPAGERQRLGLAAGPASVAVLVSGDGLLWGVALAAPRRERAGEPPASIGLLCEQGSSRRSIRVARLEARELRALSDLCRARGSAAPGAPELHGLIESALADSRRTDRVALLEEAALVLRDGDGDAGGRLARLTGRLAEAFAREGHPRPFSAVARLLLEAPGADAPPPLPEPAVRAELYGLVASGSWAEARELCRRLRFFWGSGRGADRRGRLGGLAPLVAWAEARLRSAGSRLAPGPLERGPVHPLLEEVSKEGFNALAELRAALAAGAYEDACEVIASAQAPAAAGLLPDSEDPDLFTSFRAAVARAMREHPGLERTLRERFGTAARVRVREALEEGDAEALEAAAVQFPGTEAAAEAQLWLGDRLLAAGEAAMAELRYAEALASSSSSSALHARIGPRLRLAAALRGGEAGSPPAGPVEIGAWRLEAADFERIAQAARAAARGPETADPAAPDDTAGSGGGGDDGGPGLPPPGPYRARSWARFDHLMAEDPRGVPRDEVDWIGRQVALAVEGSLRVLSDRAQVIGWDAERGERKWAVATKEDGGRWPLVAMEPVVRGGRVYVRRLLGGGAEVACLDGATGRALWRSHPGRHAASDPILSGRDILVVASSPVLEGVLELRLAALDPDSGAVLFERPLLRLRDAWEGEAPCQASLADGRIVVSAGGAVACAGPGGERQWVRRQPWLSRAEDPRWLETEHARPLVDAGRVFVSQPGVRAVECLEIESGRLLWTAAVPELRRVAGLAGGALIVAGSGGVLALEAATGRRLWRRDEPRLAAGPIGAGSTVLHAVLEGSGPPRLALAWTDASSGRELGPPQALEGLAGDRPRLGPLVSAAGRLWAVFGRTSGREQEVVELCPAGR
ncbi:MAG: PQQ-binding-like beta-propeller repeat protein [Planctomycetes bacterium]|nr:PQQ-binding-like beta-propeller repeat protein [Planctomycetota bacterium]